MRASCAAALVGKRVRVEARGLGWVLIAESLNTSIRLTKESTDGQPPDADISGSLLNLAALAGSHPEEVIQRGDVTIRGDAEVAQKFRELAMLLKPDVEEELSRLIGDTPAHQALRLVRLATGFGRRAAQTGVRNVAEYLAHERGDLVPRAEAEDFYRGVERLREDLDRVEARARLLEQRGRRDPPMKLRVLSRLIEIQRVLVRHGLDEFVRATHLYRPLRFLFLLSPWTWAVRRGDAPRAERLRLALEELGPIFVKFGQALSTRRDLLPVDIADELAKLQDRVPPFDGKVARAIIEGAYGRTAEQVFSAFEETPLAAASIAQVHAAELRAEVTLNGAKTREVVVKVLRPGMHAIIARDLEVLRELARIRRTRTGKAAAA